MGSPPSTPTWTSAAEESECSGRATSEIADTTAGHDEREGRAEKIVMAIEREMNENTQETHNSIDVGSGHLAVQVHGVVHEGRGNKPISKIDFDQTGDTECGDVREVSRATRLHDANPAGLGGMPPRPACDVCTGPSTMRFGYDTEACGACARRDIGAPKGGEETTPVAPEAERREAKRLGALDPVKMRATERSENSLTAHARFLQFVFRRTRDRAARAGRGCQWTRGGLREYAWPMWRPVHSYRCHGTRG